MSEASKLVAAAKQWATYYGDFTTGEEGAVYTVPLRVRANWDSNDADAYADVFVENGSLLIGDEQLTSRDQIRSYMAAAFANGLGGTKIAEEPVEIKLLTADVAIAITQGGIIPPGQTEVPAGGTYRATYVTVKRDGVWHLVSLQTSPLKG